MIYSHSLLQVLPALNDLSWAIQYNPDYTEAYFDRANINLFKGKFKEVLADCQRGLEIPPPNPYFNILRAMTYELMSRYKDAIADCNTALKIFRDEDLNEAAMLYTVRGRSYAVTVEFGMALLDFNKLIQLRPDDAMGYFYRGVTYANMEVLDKAIADFKKGLELKPGDVNISDSLLQAEKELKAHNLQEQLEKKARPSARVRAKAKSQTDKLKDELNQLKGEIKTIKELLIEVLRQKPEYTIPMPTKPEMDIFRMPLRDKPMRPIVMPVPEIEKKDRESQRK
ncbi:MAG: hypothetical protein AB1599_07000 [Planctomycetota bacterium]